jgi:hypothetical protein
MLRIPRWLPVLAASLALVGSGAAAAALADGSLGSVLGNAPTTTTSTGAVTTTTTTGTGDPTGGGGSGPGTIVDVVGTPRYWGPECGANPTNHGGYVTRAAKNGMSRSTAAHSPCGKPLTSVSTTTPTTAAPTTTTTTTTMAPGGASTGASGDNSSGPAGSPAPSGHGHGGGKSASPGRRH